MESTHTVRSMIGLVRHPWVAVEGRVFFDTVYSRPLSRASSRGREVSLKILQLWIFSPICARVYKSI